MITQFWELLDKTNTQCEKYEDQRKDLEEIWNEEKEKRRQAERVWVFVGVACCHSSGSGVQCRQEYVGGAQVHSVLLYKVVFIFFCVFVCREK